MSNIDNPNGFRIMGTLSGSPWQGAVREYTLDATHAAIAVGDLVQMTADGYPDVYAAGETQLLGVVVGVSPTVHTEVSGKKGDSFMSTGAVTLDVPGKNYVAANTAGVIFVCVAPDVILAAQEDADTTPLTIADIGLNVEIINAGVNATTGLSTMELDSSSAATTNTLPLRILGLEQTPGNELASVAAAAGTAQNARWLVTPANHTFSGLNVGI